MWSPLSDPVLNHPERWRIVVSGQAPEAATVPAERLRAYLHDRRSHSQAELLFGLRGETVYGLDGTFYRVEPGTVMAIAPMEPHQSGYPPSETAVDHLWISLLHDGFTARRVRVRQGRLSSIFVGEGLFDALYLPPGIRLANGFRRDGSPESLSWRRMLARTLAMNVVMALIDGERRWRGSVPPPRDAEARRQLIESICRHLHRTAGRGDSVDSLARIAGYSRYHFLRLFRQVTGATVLAYINRCREQRVRACLARGISAKAIAVELGFATPQAFSRWRRQYQPDA